MLYPRLSPTGQHESGTGLVGCGAYEMEDILTRDIFLDIQEFHTVHIVIFLAVAATDIKDLAGLH
jgi:hypothetical protein